MNINFAGKGKFSQILQPKSAGQIIVNARCAYQAVNLLIDTGAGVSLVNTRFLRQANLFDKIQPTEILIAGLGKNLIPLRGQIDLCVTIGDQITSHCYAVCDTLDNEFLIGLDLLEKAGASIDLPNKKLYLSQGSVDFMNKPISIQSRSKIRCNNSVTLKANSTGYIWGKIAICNSKNNYEGVIEPYHQLTNRAGVIITGSISYSKRNLIPVQYVNVLDTDITLYKNQLVAFFEPLRANPQELQRVNLVSSKEGYKDLDFGIPRLPDAISIEETIENGKWDDPTILHKKLGIDEMKISDAGKRDLKSLISEFSHCFAKDRFDLGEASFYKARIDLKEGYEAKWIPSRPISYKLEAHMDEEIENMLKADHITRCPYSLWNAQTFLVKKNNGNGKNGKNGKDGNPGNIYRYVQDCRPLNTECIQDCYELPRINTILDRMTDCKWLSNLDYIRSS